MTKLTQSVGVVGPVGGWTYVCLKSTSSKSCASRSIVCLLFFSVCSSSLCDFRIIMILLGSRNAWVSRYQHDNG